MSRPPSFVQVGWSVALGRVLLRGSDPDAPGGHVIQDWPLPGALAIAAQLRDGGVTELWIDNDRRCTVHELASDVSASIARDLRQAAERLSSGATSDGCLALHTSTCLRSWTWSS